METTFLMSKAILSASKDKVSKISKFLTLYFFKTIFWFFFNGFLFLTPKFFLLNVRLRHLFFPLVFEK